MTSRRKPSRTIRIFSAGVYLRRVKVRIFGRRLAYPGSAPLLVGLLYSVLGTRCSFPGMYSTPPKEPSPALNFFDNSGPESVPLLLTVYTSTHT